MHGTMNIKYSSAFFEQATPFPHIPLVHCTFNTHFNILHVNFRRTNIFLRLQIVPPNALRSYL